MKKTFETLKSHKYFNYIKLGLILIGILFLLNYVFVYAAKIIGPDEPLPPTGTWYRVSTSEVNGAYGTISPTYKDVLSPNTTTFTVTPNSGYTASATGCGGLLSGITYTTGTIDANCTVIATFTRIPAALPVINYFRANPPIVNKGGTTLLEWSVSGATSCSVTGPNFNQTGTLRTSNTPPIDVPTTYTLTCTNGDTNTGSTDICNGTVTGSKVWDDNGCSDPYNVGRYGCYVPGPYEGQSCSQFTTQSTCLQGWLTHGCTWVTPE